MIEMERKVDKNLVHKSHDDDVLIYDARHLLPAWLPPGLLEQSTLDTANRDDIQLAYRLEGERYVLRSLPESIGLGELECCGLAGCLEELRENFTLEGDRLRLTGTWVLESTEEKLARLPGVGEPLGIPERRRVHEALKRLEGCPQQGMQYFTFFNDLQNYFFYRKHHEHVPGLMLIEVARQAMYAQFYEHSGYARGEVSISIVDLVSGFPRYTESSYPVSVLVCDYDEKPRSRERKVDKRARFFQAGELVADIRLRGEVIRMPVFKRMRNISIDPTHWFRALKGIGHEALVRFDCGRHLRANLELLSLEQIEVRCEGADSLGFISESAPGQLYLHLEQFGLMALPVAAIRTVDGEGCGLLRIRLADLDLRTRFQWREVLKQFAYFSHFETLVETPFGSTAGLAAVAAQHASDTRPEV
ncbi:AfsA-related hotdog domain-containing protein [Pseudomonas sp. D(2018)]|uniref:AfsA-related hotdog domain-containing protein n=1 Tax=Pseudomonas sp. D(2018) TaxID=2502238 RepID=UPI0010F46A88|nr:AfsA-related hotdog domain-containing protein [Pseudomonas sp. D(2018)]